MRFYLRLICFSFALLYGLQIPAFVQIYSVIVDARLTEAEQNLAGFQQTADLHFDGDMLEMIEYYQTHADKLIEQTGENIRQIHQSVMRLKQQQQHLSQSEVKAAWYVLTQYNSPIWQQAQSKYNYQIQFSPVVISWGISIALLSLVAIDLIYALLLIMFALVKPKRIATQ
ncbi:hypothetical protein DS2_06016 [Catenovulum agarivorans DS-2]|uniref:DUF2937 domain-containing protein n=1 Tax=Catenovulum agarivorans DS-2 TaxID=1328313 RepID=W7QSI0_9ALTE|nr:DUF2937 family protein [Catenovulum agarivorans]EWH10823.1 hypothetical protein DS2_06016 [Catenovulum agarivorans DS-2]